VFPHHCKTLDWVPIGTSPVPRCCSITLSSPCCELHFASYVFPHGSSSAVVIGPYGGYSLAALAAKPPRLAWIALPDPHRQLLVCCGPLPAWILSLLWVHLCPGFWCRSGIPGGQAVLAVQPTDDSRAPNKGWNTLFLTSSGLATWAVKCLELLL